MWFFTVLPWKSGSYSSAERILSDLFPATPATCSTNEKTLYCCKSNKSHIWYSGAVPPALCSNHWVCKLNVQQLPLLDSGGRNPPMHLCDSPPLHSWLWKTSHHKHSKHVALFFPSSLQRKSSSLSSKCVVSTPACTQKQWTRPGSGHWGAAKSKAASCCWHQLLIWFVRGWAGWEHKQREEITETKKGKKKQQTEMKVQQHEETNRVSVRITESLNVRIGPWISCCTKVLLENAKLCILKYYEDFKRIKYYLQQRSTVYNLIFPPFLFLLDPEKSPSGNHPAAERFGDLSISQMAEHWRLDFLCVSSLSRSSSCSISVYVGSGQENHTKGRGEVARDCVLKWKKKINIYRGKGKWNESHDAESTVKMDATHSHRSRSA